VSNQERLRLDKPPRELGSQARVRESNRTLTELDSLRLERRRLLRGIVIGAVISTVMWFTLIALIIFAV
jgi:hypothetical protein